MPRSNIARRRWRITTVNTFSDQGTKFSAFSQIRIPSTLRWLAPRLRHTWCRVVDTLDRHSVGGVVDTTRHIDRESGPTERPPRKVAPPAHEPDRRASRPDRRVVPVTRRTSTLRPPIDAHAVNRPSLGRATRLMTGPGARHRASTHKSWGTQCSCVPQFQIGAGLTLRWIHPPTRRSGTKQRS